MTQLFSAWRRQRLPHGPVSQVILQASPFCNIDCDYCYLPNRSSIERLSLDLLDPIFRNLLSSPWVRDEFTVVWHAGEPLAVPLQYYEAALARISQLQRDCNADHVRIHHAMQTNATLVDPAWCDFMQAHQIRLGVSLDGPSFIHDAHRQTRSGKGTHQRVMEGIAILQHHHINFQVIMVLTLDALDYPDEIFHFFVGHGIRRIGFNVEEVEGEHLVSSLQKEGVEDRYRAFMTRFYYLTKRNAGALHVREFDHIRQLILHNRKVKSVQNTPFAMLNIAYNGDFSTFSPELLSMSSQDYGDFLLGNIRRDKFEDVVATPKFRRINRDIRVGVQNCKRTCEYFSLCGGGAPANKYYENQSLRSAETMYCRLKYKTLIDLILRDLEARLACESDASVGPSDTA